MSKISEDELFNIKKSDTIVVYGCGHSINSLEKEEIKNLSKYDSIGFNWFCFSHILTTYYLIREQANIPKRVNGNENSDNFIKIMNEEYFNSCLIIHDISNHSPQALNYADISNRFISTNIIVCDVKLKDNNGGVKKWRKNNIINNGIIHGKCTMNNVLNFAVFMRYKRIIFVGVDLYDSKYFWVKNGDTRYSVKNKNKNYRSRHAIATPTISLIKEMKNVYSDINLYTYNSKSLLKEVMPIWKK